MPLSNTELNRVADDIVSSALTIRLHTSKPGVGSAGTSGRVTSGGGSFASGVSVAASGWAAASSGDTENDADIDYGTASGGDPGTVIAWTAFQWKRVRGGGRRPEHDDCRRRQLFKINAGSLNLNGATS